MLIESSIINVISRIDVKNQEVDQVDFMNGNLEDNASMLGDIQKHLGRLSIMEFMSYNKEDSSRQIVGASEILKVGYQNPMNGVRFTGGQYDESEHR